MTKKQLNQREQLLLKHCSTPKTLENLCELFDVGYYTIRNEVANLIEHGFLVELPWRQGKKKVFQTRWDDPEASDPRLVFSFGEQQITIRQIINSFGSRSPILLARGRNVARALAYMLVNSQHRVEMNGQGSFPGEVLTLQELMETRNYFKGVTNVLDQIIAAPMWSEEPGHFLKVTGEAPVDEDYALSQEWVEFMSAADQKKKSN